MASGNLSNSVPPDSICAYPTIDSSGRLVAFVSLNTNLTTNTLAGDYHLYVRDLQAGNTRLVNANQDGQGCGVSFLSPSQFSANGRFIAFQAPDGNLVPGDRNHCEDVFLRDLAAEATELISAREPTLPSLSPSGPGGSSSWSVSGDGQFVAFATDADNVLPNDTNGRRDVFVRDLVGGTNTLVSVNTNGTGPGNEHSTDPSISGDGRFVAFSSSANDLVARDTNKECDVFVRDLLAKATTLVSVNTNGTGPGIKASSAPRISTDGRRILFRSFAYNLAPGARYPVRKPLLSIPGFGCDTRSDDSRSHLRSHDSGWTLCRLRGNHYGFHPVPLYLGCSIRDASLHQYHRGARKGSDQPRWQPPGVCNGFATLCSGLASEH